MLSRSNIIQFLKYNVGGTLYFVSAWLIITFGTKYLGLWWANLLGNGVGILLNYLTQRFWAFSDRKRSTLSTSWRYGVITVVNLFLSYFILKFLTNLGVPLWLAQFFSAGFFTFWNWIWYRYWVFKKRQK
ncbi:GtrA family protein [Candidatus Saccharibacteria bacterium]|nr:GtrA family protein [Candidatus Saccharibacteria bacterium]